MSVPTLVLWCREQGSARLAAPDHGGLQGVGLPVKARPDQLPHPLVRMVIAQADCPREYLRWDADQDISRPRPGEWPSGCTSARHDMTPGRFRRMRLAGRKDKRAKTAGRGLGIRNCVFANWGPEVPGRAQGPSRSSDWAAPDPT